MELELVTIGNELLLGFTLDTNGGEIAQMLADAGVSVSRRATVPDNPDAIRDAVSAGLQRSRLVICTGGLGPTRDDITKKTVARMFDAPLELDEAYLEQLRERFARWRGDLPMPEANRTQAEVPRGATVLPNKWGTAPGLWLTGESGDVIMLPGVPREMRGLMTEEVVPRLKERLSEPRVTRSLTIRTTGVSESALADQLQHLDESLSPVTLAYLPGLEGVDLRLTAWNIPAASADQMLESGALRLKEALGDVVYDGADVVEVILRALNKRQWTLGVAESCTGGLIAARITAIPGSSTSFLGGIVAYANQVKHQQLSVSPALIEKSGAVSAQVAVAMAEGVTRRFDASIGLAITGVAGPGGGSDEKPVGTVHIAVAGPGIGKEIKLVIPGGRTEVRARSAQAALNLLRLQLRS